MRFLPALPTGRQAAGRNLWFNKQKVHTVYPEMLPRQLAGQHDNYFLSLLRNMLRNKPNLLQPTLSRLLAGRNPTNYSTNMIIIINLPIPSFFYPALAGVPIVVQIYYKYTPFSNCIFLRHLHCLPASKDPINPNTNVFYKIPTH